MMEGGKMEDGCVWVTRLKKSRMIGILPIKRKLFKMNLKF